jgi:hypothetical protein
MWYGLIDPRPQSEAATEGYSDQPSPLPLVLLSVLSTARSRREKNTNSVNRDT